MFRCCSLETPRPRLLPQSLKDCSINLCLFFCSAYRVIILGLCLNVLFLRNVSPNLPCLGPIGKSYFNCPSIESPMVWELSLTLSIITCCLDIWWNQRGLKGHNGKVPSPLCSCGWINSLVNSPLYPPPSPQPGAVPAYPWAVSFSCRLMNYSNMPITPSCGNQGPPHPLDATSLPLTDPDGSTRLLRAISVWCVVSSPIPTHPAMRICGC